MTRQDTIWRQYHITYLMTKNWNTTELSKSIYTPMVIGFVFTNSQHSSGKPWDKRYEYQYERNHIWVSKLKAAVVQHQKSFFYHFFYFFHIFLMVYQCVQLCNSFTTYSFLYFVIFCSFICFIYFYSFNSFICWFLTLKWSIIIAVPQCYTGEATCWSLTWK